MSSVDPVDGGRHRAATALVVINIVYACLLVALSVAPAPSTVSISLPDFLVHGTLYGVQAGLLFALLAGVCSMPWAALGAWLAASLFGLAMEALQLTQLTRSSDARDLLTNTIGAALGVGLAGVVSRLRRAEPGS